MASFDGRPRLLGHIGFPLGVEVDLSGEPMTVTAGGAEIANFALEDISVTARADGFHIKAEGEEIVVNFSDAARFAIEIGLPEA